MINNGTAMLGELKGELLRVACLACLLEVVLRASPSSRQPILFRLVLDLHSASRSTLKLVCRPAFAAARFCVRRFPLPLRRQNGRSVQPAALGNHQEAAWPSEHKPHVLMLVDAAGLSDSTDSLSESIIIISRPAPVHGTAERLRNAEAGSQGQSQGHLLSHGSGGSGTGAPASCSNRELELTCKVSVAATGQRQRGTWLPSPDGASSSSSDPLQNSAGSPGHLEQAGAGSSSDPQHPTSAGSPRQVNLASPGSPSCHPQADYGTTDAEALMDSGSSEGPQQHERGHEHLLGPGGREGANPSNMQPSSVASSKQQSHILASSHHERQVGMQPCSRVAPNSRTASGSSRTRFAMPVTPSALEAEGVLGLPPCVTHLLLSNLDVDSKRVLRLVSRALYFEVGKHIVQLPVNLSNLKKLALMPLHEVFPEVLELRIHFSCIPCPSPAQLNLQGHWLMQPNAVGLLQLLPGPQGMPPPVSTGESQARMPAQQQLAKLEDLRMHQMAHFIREVIPRMHALKTLDLSSTDLWACHPLWLALVHGLPESAELILRDPTVQLQQQQSPQQQGADSATSRDNFPMLYESLKLLAVHRPNVTVDLLGVTVRRHTAVRLSQLCQLPCFRSLSLYGKSAFAVPHGHRLASHLRQLSVPTMQGLRTLELLSYEDISDAELAPLIDLPSLEHLYVDSLFVKTASGPTFPSIKSLTAARIKFILRPLTDIFPSLRRLRLGVLHSELNKKITGASLSCLAACSDMLEEVVLCPIMWKGQWQVLPTLAGLKKLVLVHCKEMSHLREVLQVIGRIPKLETLELHSCCPQVSVWPALPTAVPVDHIVPPLAVPPFGGPAAGPPWQIWHGGADQAGPGPAEAGAAGAWPDAGANVPPAALAAAGVPAAADPDAADAGAPNNNNIVVAAAAATGATLDREGENIFVGLTQCSTLHTLVLQESCTQLVRHLAAARLPELRTLRLQKMSSRLRLIEMQAAVLNQQTLNTLGLHETGDFGPADAAQIPYVLGRPALKVEWQSFSSHPQLYLTRGFSDGRRLQ